MVNDIETRTSEPLTGSNVGPPVQAGPPPTVKFSWGFLAVVCVAVWVLFFDGYSTIMTWVTPTTAPVTTLYQTATVAPTGQKIVPTGLPYNTLPVRVPVVVPTAVDVGVGDSGSKIAGNEATSQAMYLTAVAVAVDQPVATPTIVVVEATPVVPSIGSKPYVGDHPSGAVIGAPRNVQATKTCPSGQVWVDDKGCRWLDGHLANRHP